MKTYSAPYVANAELRTALQQIEQAARRDDPFVELQVLHAEPSKVRAGMVLYADGADWNPGSGEGLYRRNKTNTSWVFLG